MAKNKTKTKDQAKGPKTVPNRHLHARISFLQQAATYFAVQRNQFRTESPSAVSKDSDDGAEVGRMAARRNGLGSDEMDWQPTTNDQRSLQNMTPRASAPVKPSQAILSLHLNSHLRQVARKSQIRLHSSIKRASCKTCGAILVEGQTCSKYVDNLSKGGRKQHADVLVSECNACGTKKRFPVGATRQERKALRVPPSDQSRDTSAIVEKIAAQASS